MSTPEFDEACRRETVNWRRQAQRPRTRVSQSVVVMCVSSSQEGAAERFSSLLYDYSF
jgi:hypothetical protein